MLRLPFLYFLQRLYFSEVVSTKLFRRSITFVERGKEDKRALEMLNLNLFVTAICKKK
jgi:hypothetical protein